MQIIIPGPPISQGRPRFCRRGSASYAYDPQKCDKDRVRHDIKPMIERESVKTGICLPCSELFCVSLVFSFPCAVSVKKGLRNRFLWHADEYSKKPDLDNCEKFYLDVCNGLIWNDDSQIVSLRSTKRYEENPCTILDFVVKSPLVIEKACESVMMIFSPSELEKFIYDVRKLGQWQDIPTDIRDPRFQLIANEVIMLAKKYADDLKKIAKNA